MEKINLNLTKKKFNPSLHYYELEYLIKNGFWKKKIENSMLYGLVKRLTNRAFPNYEDEYDKRWEYFYVPVVRSGHLISVRFWILEYKKEFFVGFQGLGNLHVKKGRVRIENEYKAIFREALRFSLFIKKTKREILKKTIPYDIRTGKIKGKYVMKGIMPESKKRRILFDYIENSGNYVTFSPEFFNGQFSKTYNSINRIIHKKHLDKDLKISEISLNDYLNTAAICYQAAFGKKTKKLKPIEMYKKWADGRDGGMLSIKNWDSKEEFSNWHKGGRWAGCHPFEIVFSWHEHGIHLYPPDKERHYSLRVTNYAYADAFVDMSRALIKKGIAFEARDLADVLNYLSGESYFDVNVYGDIFHTFFYEPSKEHKKLYFPHIEWDEIKAPKWKN